MAPPALITNENYVSKRLPLPATNPHLCLKIALPSPGVLRPFCLELQQHRLGVPITLCHCADNRCPILLSRTLVVISCPNISWMLMVLSKYLLLELMLWTNKHSLIIFPENNTFLFQAQEPICPFPTCSLLWGMSSLYILFPKLKYELVRLKH